MNSRSSSLCSFAVILPSNEEKNAVEHFHVKFRNQSFRLRKAIHLAASLYVFKKRDGTGSVCQVLVARTAGIFCEELLEFSFTSNRANASWLQDASGQSQIHQQEQQCLRDNACKKWEKVTVREQLPPGRAEWEYVRATTLQTPRPGKEGKEVLQVSELRYP